MEKQAQSWSKEAGYVWSLIGSAVGFANILSFSALCYKNGGGAFLIPYVLAHLFVGIPMLLLESIVGQRSKLPFVSAMGQVSKFGKTFGWLSILTCATIGGFYIVLTGFSVAYSYFAAFNKIPSDSAHFFKNVFLNDSGSLQNIGGLSVGVFLATVAVCLVSWIILSRNIRSGVEKVCSIFLPVLGILMFALTVVSCFLPGAIDGFKHYLIPDFSRLRNWELWRDVFGQVFFSLSLGLGIVTGYSRHNDPSFNLYRSMVKVAIGDFVISLISGFAIFGCMGFMSKTAAIPFHSLVTTDSAFEIGFVIFPLILSHFGAFAQIVGPLFFFCIFIAGITGVFSIIESLAGNIEVEFNKSRKKGVTWATLLVFLLAIPFCMGNGQHILGSIAPMLLGNAMLFGGIVEIILFLYASKAVREDKHWVNKKGKIIYPHFALKYFVLPLLSLSLIGALYKEWSSPLSAEHFVRWGWLIIALAISYFLGKQKKEAIVAQNA